MYNLENRWISLHTLRKLNSASITRGYNRNLNIGAFEAHLKDKIDEDKTIAWRGMDTTVGLFPLMLHDHKCGTPCETHLRCQVFTDGMCGYLTMLDVPLEMFEALEDFLPPLEDESN